MGNNGKIDGELVPFVHNGVEYKLLHQERLFAIAYVQNGCKGGEAVLAAGYRCKSKDVASSVSSELLRRPRIFEFIRALQDDIAFQLGITALDIAREYAKVGFGDMRKVFDPETGEVLEISAIDDITAASIASYEALEVYEPRSGKFIGKNKKIKFHPKLVALDSLAKMIGADAKTQSLQPAKPAPLEITVVHSDTKMLKNEDNPTVPGTPAE